MKFSANLGFLWADRPLPEAIRAAKLAGFDAVECHWPYDESASEVAEVLKDTGLTMLGLNTRRGNAAMGEFGLSAVPGREDEARETIDEALTYAKEIGCLNVHVMAGIASGEAAKQTFVNTLKYACTRAAGQGTTILIEPLNTYDAPGYFLKGTDQALAIIQAVDASNLKLMFDCYHVQLMEGDLSHKLSALLPWIGHIQFASVPDRGQPDHGEVNYAHVFQVITDLGYSAPLGAEYKPVGPTDQSLRWMQRLCPKATR
ncbi:MAG: TIM barrel protein [Pseudoruegeria sp.]